MQCEEYGLPCCYLDFLVHYLPVFQALEALWCKTKVLSGRPKTYMSFICMMKYSTTGKECQAKGIPYKPARGRRKVQDPDSVRGANSKDDNEDEEDGAVSDADSYSDLLPGETIFNKCQLFICRLCNVTCTR